MDDDRYEHLMSDDGEKLTAEEMSSGWHFCPCWDGLLIGPGMDRELECCECGTTNTEEDKR